MSLSSETCCLVDAHVHLHPCFDVAKCLNAARLNFQHHANRLKIASPFLGILMLTEISGIHAFSDLADRDDRAIGDWTIAKTKESVSLKLTHVSGDVLLLVAGRQVVTKEKVEVLTLVTDSEIEDGLSLVETLDRAIAQGSIPVLPWGAGKWIGDRGRLVQTALRTAQVFAGDNGGRPGLWPLPKFARMRAFAGETSLVPLPGSDSLPLSSDIERAGSFGFVVQGVLDDAKPGESLKNLLRNANTTIEPYGRSLSPWTFIKNQTLLRLA